MSVNHQPNSPLAKAQRFQGELMASFPERKEAILQLVEALAGTIKPTSVVELSQATPFQRTHTNVHKAIDSLSGKDFSKDMGHKKFLERTRKWTNLFASLVPQEVERLFKLCAIDASSIARLYAQTLEDRSYVHQAAQLGSPVTVGVQVSTLVLIPEKVAGEAKWTLPLSVERIPSSETPTETARRQLIELQRIWPNDLCVIAVDSGYTSLEPYSENQIVIARGRIDRTGRRPVFQKKEEKEGGRGRPRKYLKGVLHFAKNIPMGDEGGPDEEVEYECVYGKHRVTGFLSRWNNVYVHGQSKPVDVVKCEFFLSDDPSKTLFPNPLLLIVTGLRRQELSSVQIFESYFQRFDIEHFFRFQKQQLLFAGFQTPELQRQINWWWICLMAYWLLYMVRAIAPESNCPWRAKKKCNMTASPGEVKRVFGSKIFSELGSPSGKPITRGKSKGRKKGTFLAKRERKKPIKKARKEPSSFAA